MTSWPEKSTARSDAPTPNRADFQGIARGDDGTPGDLDSGKSLPSSLGNIGLSAHQRNVPPTMEAKVVYVNSYTRLRFGKLELVRAHTRSLPNQ